MAWAWARGKGLFTQELGPSKARYLQYYPLARARAGIRTRARARDRAKERKQVIDNLNNCEILGSLAA